MSLYPAFLKLTKRWFHALASRPMFERFLQHANSADNSEGAA